MITKKELKSIDPPIF